MSEPAIKHVSFKSLENQGSYRFRFTYVTDEGSIKRLSEAKSRQLLAEALRDALAFIESDAPMVRTGFSGFGRVNVWMEGA